ncbi:MAG: DUF3090 family protein [Candidatus Rokubacteria bacterium]|nr:DUF3090 family protein [Candidatus Rokubacteria bacterium]
MNPSFDLEAPDHFTAGAAGPPGQRVFFLQAREAGLVVTLKAEKEQIAALAEYLAGLLAKVPASGALPADLDLLDPAEPVWAIGSIGVGYDEARDRIIVVASEAVEGAEDEEEAEEGGEGTATAAAPPPPVEEAEERPDPDVAEARFRLTREQAAAFVDRGRSLVRAGRPSCPICSQPMDPAGHVCPRSNGHVHGTPGA